MNAQQLLQEIAEYCRRTGLAESTFGRRAVNDGKLATRLRNGGRITTETLDRIRSFMDANHNPVAAANSPVIAHRQEFIPMSTKAIAVAPDKAGDPDPQRNFRFFDNRQKYLLFVNTCSEKLVVANRISQ